MANPVVSATAAEWQYQPNSFLLSYCNSQGLDPAGHYVESRDPGDYQPLMFDIYVRPA